MSSTLAQSMLPEIPLLYDPEGAKCVIKVKGVVAPEGCVDPDKFLVELLQGGARIHETETVKTVLEASPHPGSVKGG